MYVTEFIINLNKITLSQVRKYVLISFFIVGAYSILEILRIYNIINVDEILMNTSYYIQKLNRGVLYGDRIRSVTGEASFLGMYIAFAYPWIVSYIFTEKKYTKKVLYALLVIYMLLLVYLTKSRSAYAVVMGEMGLTLFGILLFDKKKVNKILVVVVTICCAVSISGFNRLNDYIISLSQEENTEQIEVVDDGYNIDMSVGDVVQSLNSKTNHSNIARVGLQKSAVKMGISHPIFGVGLGQFGFYADEYIDESTRISNEIQNWMNPESVDYWPPAFALIPRIIGEQGIVGVSFFSFGLLAKYVIITNNIHICGKAYVSALNVDTTTPTKLTAINISKVFSFSFIYLNTNLNSVTKINPINKLTPTIPCSPIILGINANAGGQ